MKLSKIISSVIVFTLLTTGCSFNATAPQTQSNAVNVSATQFDNAYGDYAYAFLSDYLKAYPVREGGTKQEVAAAKYLAAKLTSYKLKVHTESFKFITDEDEVLASQNVIASLNPEVSKRILIGAHYDAVTDGQGADDNGSGVAAVVTLAKYLKSSSSKLGIDFVLFGSEEYGCKGSEAYYAAHKISKTLPVLMINFDSIAAGDQLNVYGESEKSIVLKNMLKIVADKKYPVETQNEKASGLPYGMTLDASDHAIFKNNGIPILYFEATNWQAGKHDGYTQTTSSKVKTGEFWHTSQDKLSFIESVFKGRPKQNLSLSIDLVMTFLQKGLWQ